MSKSRANSSHPTFVGGWWAYKDALVEELNNIKKKKVVQNADTSNEAAAKSSRELDPSQ